MTDITQDFKTKSRALAFEGLELTLEHLREVIQELDEKRLAATEPHERFRLACNQEAYLATATWVMEQLEEGEKRMRSIINPELISTKVWINA